MARELVPAEGFGRALYDLLHSRRRENGTVWRAEELAAEMAERGVQRSAKQVRDWIAGRSTPGADALVVIAEIFAVAAGPLWRGVIEPINLPQDVTSEAGATSDGGRREHDARVQSRHQQVQADKERSAQQQRRARRKKGRG